MRSSVSRKHIFRDGPEYLKGYVAARSSSREEPEGKRIRAYKVGWKDGVRDRMGPVGPVEWQRSAVECSTSATSSSKTAAS